MSHSPSARYSMPDVYIWWKKSDCVAGEGTSRMLMIDTCLSSYSCWPMVNIRAMSQRWPAVSDRYIIRVRVEWIIGRRDATNTLGYR